MAPLSDVVLVSVADHIATITLNRPDARNALNSAVRSGLRSAMAAVESDDQVHVIVLTGSDPAFCAGLDLKELGTPSTAGSSGGAEIEVDVSDNPYSPKAPWAAISKPLIGAVNGVAITGGFELALQCDFIVASERAAFGDTHTRVGVLPGWGLSVLLPQAVGYRRALEMSMTGNFMLAEEALAFGLVNHVVPHDELLKRTYELASNIVGNNTPAIRALLASYRAIHTMTVADGLRHETQVNREYGATFDASDVAERRESIRQRGRIQI
jgi:enoyl-CoA hydratase